MVAAGTPAPTKLEESLLAMPMSVLRAKPFTLEKNSMEWRMVSLPVQVK